MGKVGRFACIFVPMALSIVSLICLVMVFTAGQSSSSKHLYFARLDLSNITSTPKNLPKLDGFNDTDLPAGVPTNASAAVNSAIAGALTESFTAGNISKYYQIYLWNYCSGNSTDDLNFCSPRTAKFYFNPIQVWGLQQNSLEAKFSNQTQAVIDAYSKAAEWMFTGYSVALALTIANIVVGGLAIFSRIGSCATFVLAAVAAVFDVGAATLSTVIYAGFVGGLDAALQPYGLKATLGSSMLGIDWLGAIASAVAAFFWLFTVCCVSGKSNKKKMTVEKTPYTYERVASPFGNHGDQVPLTQMQPHDQHSYGPAAYNNEPYGNTSYGNTAAYEPYRHADAAAKV